MFLCPLVSKFAQSHHDLQPQIKLPYTVTQCQQELNCTSFTMTGFTAGLSYRSVRFRWVSLFDEFRIFETQKSTFSYKYGPLLGGRKAEEEPQRRDRSPGQTDMHAKHVESAEQINKHGSMLTISPSTLHWFLPSCSCQISSCQESLRYIWFYPLFQSAQPRNDDDRSFTTNTTQIIWVWTQTGRLDQVAPIRASLHRLPVHIRSERWDAADDMQICEQVCLLRTRLTSLNVLLPHRSLRSQDSFPPDWTWSYRAAAETLPSIESNLIFKFNL